MDTLADDLLAFVEENLRRQVGSLLDVIPESDRARMTEIYRAANALQDEGGLDIVADELGQLWCGLKSVLPDSKLDDCFVRVLGIVIEGDMTSPLREAHAEITQNYAAASKSKALLIKAAVTSGLAEDYYLDKWVDGDALSADLAEYWERRYGVDVLFWFSKGTGGKTRGAGADSTAAGRQVLRRQLVDTVPVDDFDAILATIVTKLSCGDSKANRDMLRRYRKGQRA